MSTYPFIQKVGTLVLDITFEISDIPVPVHLLEEHSTTKWCNFLNKKAKEYPKYSDKSKLLHNATYVIRSIQKENGRIETVTSNQTFSFKKRICFTVVFKDITSEEDYLWLMSQKFGNVLLNKYVVR